jgi:acetylornithine deacetylase
MGVDIKTRGKSMENVEVIKRVSSEIDKMKEEIISTLRDLVKIPSVVGQEGPAQNYVEHIYRSLGLNVIILGPNIDRVKGHPSFIDTEMSYEGRQNVIGVLSGDPNSPSIILNGHIDVVSPEPVHAWSHDPWGGVIVGEKMYGRGTGDMKAGLLANYYALKGILTAGFKPKGKVMLQSVIDEEAGGAGGTLACLMEGYTADGMICTEG